MELPELSLAPTQFVKSNSSSSGSEQSSCSRKRKLLHHDHHHHFEPAPIQTTLDLQLKDPLPLDWEQCLDLESGKMYYLNRKTLRRSWNWPKDQTVDLELNISSLSSYNSCSSSSNSNNNNNNGSSDTHHQISSHKPSCSSSGNMVALACLNCHLLVILSKSSPSCPNCKFLHSLPNPLLNSTPLKPSSNTLSLLN